MSVNECDGVWMWGLLKVSGFMSKVNEVTRLGPSPKGLLSLEEEETSGVHVHREKGRVRTQQDGGHLLAKERGIGRERPALLAP